MSKRSELTKWDMFFIEKEKLDPRDHERKQTIIRIPLDLMDYIRQDMRLLEDARIDINFNEYVVLSLMIMSSTMLNPKLEFTSMRGRKDGNLRNYLKKRESGSLSGE